MRVWIIVIVISIIFISSFFAINNYANETNKIRSDIIITNITVKDISMGWGYYSIIDTQGRGYYTSFISTEIRDGHEYKIAYFCDKDDIRRIVNMTDISKNIYTCDVGGCGK